MNLGLFTYDTTNLEANSPSTFATYFTNGDMDGWSYGSVFYAEYSSSTYENYTCGVGACLASQYCWGSFLYYDGTDYKAYKISFKASGTIANNVPDVTSATSSGGYWSAGQGSLATNYMANDSAYTTSKQGALFYKWIPTTANPRIAIGDTQDVYTFSPKATNNLNF